MKRRFFTYPIFAGFLCVATAVASLRGWGPTYAFSSKPWKPGTPRPTGSFFSHK